MYPLTFIHSLLCASSIAISLAAAAPLCSNITNAAGGSLPNIVVPIISPSAVKEFQLTLFLENLEAYFFSAGLENITKWGAGEYANDTIDIVSKVAAQEQVHVATIVALLEAYDAAIIPPCNYTFPVNSTQEFFELAEIIASVGVGATIGLAERLALTDPLLIKSISSILAVESRHDAFFRHVEGKAPNPVPFDTGISKVWAYNLAMSFIVPGSCPIEIPLPIFPVLQASNTTSWKPDNTSAEQCLLEFSWDPFQAPFVAEAGKQLLVGWVNQLNTPVYTPLNITVDGTGMAHVPHGMNGVTFAAVTTQQPDNVDDLTLATLAGPVALVLS